MSQYRLPDFTSLFPDVPVGVLHILEERYRQIFEKGYTPEHDDSHSGPHYEGHLARAGAAYALASCGLSVARDIWPWKDGWKPGQADVEGRIRNLEKAGALIAAEIDRLTQRK